MGSPRISYSFPDTRHLQDSSNNQNGNNGFPVIDYEFNHLSNELEIQVLGDRVTTLEEKLQREMDFLNGEIDDLRAGHVDLSSMNDELNNNLHSLHSNQMLFTAEQIGLKKSLGRIVGFLSGISIAAIDFVGYAWSVGGN